MSDGLLYCFHITRSGFVDPGKQIGETPEGITFAVPSGGFKDNHSSRKLYSEVPGLGCLHRCRLGAEEIQSQ